MELFIECCGFVGAWLLVAGPTYQASLELRDEDIEIDRIRSVRANITVAKKVSVWWWFLPPLKIILQRRRNTLYRHEYFQALSKEDVEALVSFTNKASAWLFVAAGGVFLAVKETYELLEEARLSTDLLWPIVAGMILLSIANIIIRSARNERLLTK